MIGNLKMYLGLIDHNGERVYDVDVYGEFLRELLVPILPRTYFLWILRLVLIGAVVLHVHAAYGLTILNRQGIEAGACECYRIIADQHRHLLEDLT